MSLGRIPVIPTVVVLAAVAVMLRLGFWQLDRLEEKEALIAEYERNSLSSSVVDLSRTDPAEVIYRTVRLDCSAPSEWNAVAGRSAAGQSGYVHRYQCYEGEVFGFDAPGYIYHVYADIGWSRGPDRADFAGAEVTGRLVPLGNGYKVVASTPFAGLEPVAEPNPNDLPNNHLAYAVQWFLFAGIALIIYVLALRRRWR